MTPMGPGLSLSQNKNITESSSSAERQVKLRQLTSQDLADEISEDVQNSLLSPNDFFVECVTIIRQM